MPDYKDFYGDPPGPRIALIRERRTFSQGGLLAMTMTILCGVVGLVSLFVVAGAVQVIAAGTIMTACIVFFGLMALIGRERAYIVYRDLPPKE